MWQNSRIRFDRSRSKGICSEKEGERDQEEEPQKTVNFLKQQNYSFANSDALRNKL